MSTHCRQLMCLSLLVNQLMCLPPLVNQLMCLPLIVYQQIASAQSTNVTDVAEQSVSINMFTTSPGTRPPPCQSAEQIKYELSPRLKLLKACHAEQIWLAGAIPEHKCGDFRGSALVRQRNGITSLRTSANKLCILHINRGTDYQPVIPSFVTKDGGSVLHDYQIAVIQHQNLVTRYFTRYRPKGGGEEEEEDLKYLEQSG